MIGLSSFVVSLAAAAMSHAAPTAPLAPQVFEERGPMNFTLDFDHPLSKRFGTFAAREIGPRSNTNYVQNYKTGGSVNFNPSTNSFSLNWNTQQDFVVGVGWQTGSNAYVLNYLCLIRTHSLTKHLRPITHSGSFAVNSGLGSLGVYGWTTNPLVEY